MSDAHRSPQSVAKPSSRHKNLRAQVIELLVKVQKGHSLHHLLDQTLKQVAEKDRALLHELTLGCLRQWFVLQSISQAWLDKPIKDAVPATAISLGLYQILATRIPPHAAISETVDAVKQLKAAKTSGLVNAILRRATRELSSAQQQFNSQHSLADWLYKQLIEDWGQQKADEIALQLRQIAPLTLRINQRQTERADYLTLLDAEAIEAEAIQLNSVGINLKQTVNIQQLPYYEQGWFSVQDAHAQLCNSLLDNLDQKIVVDACAAPGGKSCHLLEQYQPKQLIALDLDTLRLAPMEQNLARLQLNAASVQLVATDATQWQADELVDCILLDAPCTATGVIRRHPDINLLRRRNDIEKTVKLQQQLLEQLWAQLKPGGSLIYMTCSILAAENSQQISQFLDNHANAQEQILEVDWGEAQRYGRQLFPQRHGGDGFYYCKLRKLD